MTSYRTYMRRCLELARRAEGETDPNPMVGAVVVRDDRIVAEGWHRGPGRAHAEVEALEHLKGPADGATLVVNLEPCCHFGRTPPCTDALLRSGIRRVVVGMVDPNPLVSGKGIRRLRDAGVEVVLGVEEARCLQLNRGFIERIQHSVDCGALDPPGFHPGQFLVEKNAGPGRFVILSAPRTGSNFLCSFLDSHPRILCHHELFNLDAIRYALSVRDAGFSLGSLQERDVDPVGFLHRAWRQHQGAFAVGFKLSRRHPEFVFRDVIADRGVEKIVLRRRNLLKTYVSELVAQREQRWTHYGEHPEQLEELRVEVDTEEFFAFAREYDAFYARLFRAMEVRGESWLDVEYERLFLPSTLHAIFDRVGLPGSDLRGLRGATPKRNADDLERTIENYADVERALVGTRYEADLHDVTAWLRTKPLGLGVTLLVRDLARSEDFYRRVLGIHVFSREPGVQACLTSGEVMLTLRASTVAVANEPSSGSMEPLEMIVHVDSIEESFARAVSAGWPVLEGLQTHDRPAFRIEDPDGHAIRVIETPRSAGSRSVTVACTLVEADHGSVRCSPNAEKCG